MAASIRKRLARSGEPSFIVRYRLGGRAYPLQTAGTFKTNREAKIRRDLVAGEIAAGRNPRLLLEQLQAPRPVVKTFRTWADEYRVSRVDVVAETRRGIQVRTAPMMPVIGDLDPEERSPPRSSRVSLPPSS